MIGVPRVEPGADRELLGFARAARSAFAFLEEFGFGVTAESSTFVRFESDAVFVNVFHGRGSYELGVEIGHLIEVDGELVEQKFPLADVVALSVPLDDVGFQSFATTKADRLPTFLEQLADWTRRFAGPVLRGDPGVFVALSAANAQRSIAMQEAWRATRLRNAADVAGRAKDYPRVVDAYSEMISELRTVALRPSELARLRYAEGQLDI